MFYLIQIYLDLRWPSAIVRKHGFNFIFNNYLSKDGISFWITVLGDKALAGRYMYKISIQNTMGIFYRKVTFIFF